MSGSKSCAPAADLLKRIDHDFDHHSPAATAAAAMSKIRDRAKGLALDIALTCPPGRELSTALTKLEEAVFWANAAIARGAK